MTVDFRRNVERERATKTASRRSAGFGPWRLSTSIYDKQGNELHTWRYATEASVDPATVARRVAKDVAWILNTHRSVPIHCVEGGASELRALPEALALTLPANTLPVELVDFEYLMGYLEEKCTRKNA